MKKQFSNNAVLRANGMAKSMYGFSIGENEDIVDAAERAANCIYTVGLSFRGGALSSGSNNAWAFYAADAFRDRLDELKGVGTEKAAFFAGIIEARQEFDDLSEQCPTDPVVRQKLQEIYDAVNDPQKNSIGWVPSGQPSSYDVYGRYISPNRNNPQP